jgi:hypothetical protein
MSTSVPEPDRPRSPDLAAVADILDVALAGIHERLDRIEIALTALGVDPSKVKRPRRPT